MSRWLVACLVLLSVLLISSQATFAASSQVLDISKAVMVASSDVPPPPPDSNDGSGGDGSYGGGGGDSGSDASSTSSGYSNVVLPLPGDVDGAEAPSAGEPGSSSSNDDSSSMSQIPGGADASGDNFSSIPGGEESSAPAASEGEGTAAPQAQSELDAGPVAKKANTVVPKLASSPLDWTVYRHDNAHTGYSTETLKLPLELGWRYITVPNSGIPSSPAVSGGVAYFCSSGRLYALNADSGEVLWSYPSDRRLTGEIRTSPLIGDDLVYFGAGDGKLYAIRKEDGQQAWNFVAGAALNSSPLISDGILYFGSASAKLYALDARTGKPKWPGGFRTPDAIETAPAISGGMIYFVSRDMVLWCALSSNGKVKWNQRIGPPTPASTPVVSGDTVYLAVGSHLQAFSAQTGHIAWTVSLPDEISAAPAVTGDGIYLPCKDGYLYGLSINGKKKWQKAVEIGVSYAKSTNPGKVLIYSYASPVVAGKTVFLAGNKGVVLAADADTGEVKWRYEVSPSRLGYGKMSTVNIAASPIVANGSLYVFTDDGTLISFRQNMTNYTKPEVTKLYPPRDSVLPGAPPFFVQATLGDSGSGIDPKSIVMTLDDVPVEYKVLAGRGVVSYSTPVTETVDPLADGRHTASVSVGDWLGNKTTTRWSFTVDNRITVALPAAGTEGQNGLGGQQGQNGQRQGPAKGIGMSGGSR